MQQKRKMQQKREKGIDTCNKREYNGNRNAKEFLKKLVRKSTPALRRKCLLAI
jgi:hypothetical protein